MPLRWLGLGTGVAGLAASGLFGGLETVAKPEVPTVAVGKAVDGGPWSVTVTGGRLVGKLPTLYLRDGKRWFTVLATIENTADESRADFDDAIRLSGVAGIAEERPSQVLLVRDGSKPTYLNPGLPERLAFLWEQDDSTPAPKSVKVQVWGTTRRLDTIGDTWEWLDPERRAEVEVPVQDRRAG
ncbi:hypothetical protein [Plantactinospora sp. KLBMP9567]|uniref:hypothetical protein n=1 Tax=Plantactinospora sp. KLBMP9567 TaxID=3085900 RepID=UPI0029817A13|nr:hypothetical protein [Plantactinospora sp. KLBMP9567]MDW5323934.1 hypothetical protein [Plantactinospora sp. KLBMP9567]